MAVRPGPASGCLTFKTIRFFRRRAPEVKGKSSYIQYQERGSPTMARSSGRTAGKPGRQARFASRQIPLYYQLAGVLREKIVSGEFGVGEKIPTEAELVAMYGVSRITVR